MQLGRFATSSLTDARIIRILSAALEAVEPRALVRHFLGTFDVPAHSRCFLLGLGKAAEAMTRGAADALGSYEAALVITKRLEPTHPAGFTAIQASHPIPDVHSVTAGEAALKFAAGLGEDDLLICLISGGGSALAMAPLEGVSLPQIQAVTSAALASGADIEEINNLRRCLDRLKGGGLAARTRAHVLGIILSDVIGDQPQAIASGPTVPFPPNLPRAFKLLDRLPGSAPSSIKRRLESSGIQPSKVRGDRLQNVIIGNAALAANAARSQAQVEGFAADVLHPAFDGEASIVGLELGRMLAVKSQSRSRPFCLIAIGESTVTMPEIHGRGGRNQELALSAVLALEETRECMLVALATDGEDGPTDAAGAVVTSKTSARARELGLRSTEHLDQHNSYPYFEALGDLLKPGPTGTNVNDLVLLLAL